MSTVPSQRGFTLVELMVAVVLFEVGLLALLSTTAAVTRMLARGRHATQAAMFATQRLERLRVTACASQAVGAEVRSVAGVPIDSLTWRFVDAGNQHWRIVLRTSYRTAQGAWRRDSLETEISCLL
jgi:prepilin-type N-terminal cleavage/methylation domain-containing protein